MEILRGAPVAAALNEQLTKETADLQTKGVSPALAIVRVGERPDDVAYENGAVKRCEKTGVRVTRVGFPADVSQEALQNAVKKLNNDPLIHGVLLLRPLPAHLDETLVCETLSPDKDVDGITHLSLAGVFSGTAIGYPPCTPQACLEILDYYHIECAGKKAVVVGRSLVFGKPAAMMLLRRNATVTICHTKTVDLPSVCRDADILIVGAGRREMIGKEFFHANQIVLDVGIHADENGKFCGDVNFAEADGLVQAITPVPGGVGTVTTSVLVKHIIKAARKSACVGESP